MRLTHIEEQPFHTLQYSTSGPGGRVREAVLPFFHATAVARSRCCLLLTADLQGRVDGRLLGEALADELEVLIELGEMPEPNGIALAGDLYDHPELAKLGASGEVSAVYRAMSVLGSVVGVLGNHDQLDSTPDHVRILDGEVTRWCGLSVGGVGGIIGDPKRPMRRTAVNFQTDLRKVLAKRPELVLLHQGPPGKSDGQLGAEEIGDVLPASRPVTVVCGHCHWPTPLSESDQRQILNVDGRVVVVQCEAERS